MAELNDRLEMRSPAGKAAERERLGWVRQPAVRWLDPAILAREAVQVAVSYAFGRFADKRELQGDPQAPLDRSGSDELWLDFLSDTGDGWEATQTMAWLLAQPELPGPDGRALRRGSLLLLGGDQVYPSASAQAYEDRFIGPFAAASPPTGRSRELLAVPGNHDWYDGLSSFLRIFCRPESIGRKEIGDWRTNQTRSYWVLKLPRGWWLWAIDIQLDTYLDSRQLQYFAERGDELEPGDQVILITAKPSWVKVEVGKPEPESWRYLAYFEREMIAARGARLVLTLTGDLHHYSRYEPEAGAGEGPVRITAGGGGAYLSPTHTLPESVPLRAAPDAQPVPYRRGEVYPRSEQSRRLRWGILGLPFGTPRFGIAMGALYGLLGAAALGGLTATGTGLAAGAEAGFSSFLDGVLGGALIVVVALLALLLIAYTDLPGLLRVLTGLGEAALHGALAVITVYLVLLPFPSSAPGLALWLVALAACFVVGFLLGSFVFAAVILAIHVVRGPAAPRHTNEVFAGQAIADYKNFLRLHFDGEGRLTVYPLGVERICQRWELREVSGWRCFVPREGAPTARVVDGPLTFEPPRRRES